jgi:ABC-type Zn2+ transport system substrate-binding protein/surface adhesin
MSGSPSLSNRTARRWRTWVSVSRAWGRRAGPRTHTAITSMTASSPVRGDDDGDDDADDDDDDADDDDDDDRDAHDDDDDDDDDDDAENEMDTIIDFADNVKTSADRIKSSLLASKRRAMDTQSRLHRLKRRIGSPLGITLQVRSHHRPSL